MAFVLTILPVTGAVYPYFLMQALCLALFACAFNLLIGYVGLLSFGHAMFFGIGSYVAAHMAKLGTIDVGLRIAGHVLIPTVTLDLGPQRPEVALLFGIAAASLLGIIFGLLAIRRQGIYFAMTTLAFAQMIYFFCLQAPFTHGEDGIQGVPPGTLFGVFDFTKPLALYYAILLIFLAGFLLIRRTVNSPFGEVLKAIRENEPRAISLGYKTDRYKLGAFVISAALAGLAGAMKAFVAQNASLTDVHWSTSGEVILMTLVGGLGTLFGPVVGAFIVVAMQQYLAGVGQWVLVIQGVVFVVCVLAFRRGIVGEIAHRLRLSL
jgi:branched-chain amino acid transport system permease protein